MRAADSGIDVFARSSKACVNRGAFPLDKDLHGGRQPFRYSGCARVQRNCDNGVRPLLGGQPIDLSYTSTVFSLRRDDLERHTATVALAMILRYELKSRGEI